MKKYEVNKSNPESPVKPVPFKRLISLFEKEPKNRNYGHRTNVVTVNNTQTESPNCHTVNSKTKTGFQKRSAFANIRSSATRKYSSKETSKNNKKELIVTNAIKNSKEPARDHTGEAVTQSNGEIKEASGAEFYYREPSYPSSSDESEDESFTIQSDLLHSINDVSSNSHLQNLEPSNNNKTCSDTNLLLIPNLKIHHLIREMKKYEVNKSNPESPVKQVPVKRLISLFEKEPKNRNYGHRTNVVTVNNTQTESPNCHTVNSKTKTGFQKRSAFANIRSSVTRKYSSKETSKNNKKELIVTNAIKKSKEPARDHTGEAVTQSNGEIKEASGAEFYYREPYYPSSSDESEDESFTIQSDLLHSINDVSSNSHLQNLEPSNNNQTCSDTVGENRINNNNYAVILHQSSETLNDYNTLDFIDTKFNERERYSIKGLDHNERTSYSQNEVSKKSFIGTIHSKCNGECEKKDNQILSSKEITSQNSCSKLCPPNSLNLQTCYPHESVSSKLDTYGRINSTNGSNAESSKTVYSESNNDDSSWFNETQMFQMCRKRSSSASTDSYHSVFSEIHDETEENSLDLSREKVYNEIYEKYSFGNLPRVTYTSKYVIEESLGKPNEKQDGSQCYEHVYNNKYYQSYDSDSDDMQYEDVNVSLDSPTTGPNVSWWSTPAVAESKFLCRLTDNELKLFDSIHKIITSEREFLNSCELLLSHFIASPELNDETILSEENCNVLFGDVKSVLKVSTEYYAELEKCKLNEIFLHGIFNIITEHFSRNSHVYVTHCKNQMYLDRTFIKLMEDHGQFYKIVQHLQSAEKCQKRPLYYFLLLPRKKLRFIKSQLTKILQQMDKDNKEYESCLTALTTVQEVIDNCNKETILVEQRDEMASLDKLIYFNKDLKPFKINASNRWLIYTGELQQIVHKRDDEERTLSLKPVKTYTRHLFLFSDTLMITNKSNDGSYTVIDYCERNNLKAEDADSSSQIPAKYVQGKHLLRIILHTNKEKPVKMVYSFTDKVVRDRWLKSLLTGHVHSLSLISNEKQDRNDFTAPNMAQLPAALSNGSELPQDYQFTDSRQSQQSEEDLGPFNNIKEKRLNDLKKEIITSESAYLSSLGVIEQHFKPGFSSSDDGVISEYEKKILFANITSVIQLSSKFLMALRKCLIGEIVTSEIFDVIKRYVSEEFEAYISYCSHQSLMLKTLENLMKNNSKFMELMQQLQTCKCCNNLPFQSYLTLPTQRIMRFPLLLSTGLSYAKDGTEDYISCAAALEGANEIVKKCNDEARRIQDLEGLLEWSQKLQFKDTKYIPIFQTSRYVVYSGHVTRLIWENGSNNKHFTLKNIDLHMILFNDLLVLTKKNSDLVYTVVDYCLCNFIRISREDEEMCMPEKAIEGCHMLKLILEKNHLEQLCIMILKIPSEAERHKWIQNFDAPKLLTQVDKDKEKNLPNYIFKAKVIRAFNGHCPWELSINENDIINVTDDKDHEWLCGTKETGGPSGWFPSQCIRIIESNKTDEIETVNLSRTKSLESESEV